MKSRSPWAIYAIPISLVIWAGAVCLVHGEDELMMRAGFAIWIYIMELIVVGPVCAVYLVLKLLWDYPRKSRESEQIRRAREGRCLYCGYLLTGNTSGVCPECGRLCTQPVPFEPPRTPPNSVWAVGLIVSLILAVILLFMIV